MDAILILQQKRLLRVDEAARILNVSRWTVYRWVEDGKLGGTRLGAGSLRIFSETVAALIDHHCVGVPVTAVVPQGSQAFLKTSGASGRQDSNRVGVRPRQQAAL
jgi:excisionase family DNA binding protein